MNSVPSDNIIELRRLSEKLCKTDDDNNYKEVIIEMKKIVESSKSEIEKNNTPKEMVKCYESMCAAITNLLLKLK